ncbi:hypothetical protein BDA96_09G199000 [Sorghum bicolor]|uniref:Uncharacterized protein n=2 Tax=Sorghum bicolor TaxID=4558 RepID=A0A921U564_SORBI|nr:hypothetical protein BDA96_09G199000 [Sorghum bicolor]KXG22287.1 hypothetical protein SORBI_3009G188200 [Sorghum bicolor]
MDFADTCATTTRSLEIGDSVPELSRAVVRKLKTFAKRMAVRPTNGKSLLSSALGVDGTGLCFPIPN